MKTKRKLLYEFDDKLNPLESCKKQKINCGPSISDGAKNYATSPKRTQSVKGGLPPSNNELQQFSPYNDSQDIPQSFAGQKNIGYFFKPMSKGIVFKSATGIQCDQQEMPVNNVDKSSLPKARKLFVLIH